jgi:hypothetical protein
MPFGRRLLCVLSILAAVFLTSPVQAAPAPDIVKVLPDDVCGPRELDAINVCGGPVARDDVRRLHALAACLVYWQRHSSETAVTAYLSGGDKSRLRSVIASDHSCPKNAGSRVSGVLLAGALAEAILADRRFETSVPVALQPTASPVDCLFVTGRVEAIALMRSTPLSRGEREAVRPLLARLSRCLPEGASIQTSLYVLRAVAALRLFAGTLPPTAQTPLQTVALDLPGTVSTISGTPTIGLSNVPMVSIKPASSSDADTGPFQAKHVSPMSGQPFDPEELLANESIPAIDPDTGETIVHRPGIEGRRDGGDPY